MKKVAAMKFAAESETRNPSLPEEMYVFDVDVIIEAIRVFERQTYFERVRDSLQEEGFEDAMTVEMFGSAPVMQLESVSSIYA